MIRALGMIRGIGTGLPRTAEGYRLRDKRRNLNELVTNWLEPVDLDDNELAITRGSKNSFDLKVASLVETPGFTGTATARYDNDGGDALDTNRCLLVNGFLGGLVVRHEYTLIPGVNPDLIVHGSALAQRRAIEALEETVTALVGDNREFRDSLAAKQQPALF